MPIGRVLSKQGDFIVMRGTIPQAIYRLFPTSQLVQNEPIRSGRASGLPARARPIQPCKPARTLLAGRPRQTPAPGAIPSPDPPLHHAVAGSAIAANQRGIAKAGMAGQLDHLARDLRQPSCQELRVFNPLRICDTCKPVIAWKASPALASGIRRPRALRKVRLSRAPGIWPATSPRARGFAACTASGGGG